MGKVMTSNGNDAIDLAALAKLVIESINATPKPFPARITLIFPGMEWQEKPRLTTNRTGPVGYPVQEGEDGLWVVFDALDVLAWLTANGVVKLTVRGSRA